MCFYLIYTVICVSICLILGCCYFFKGNIGPPGKRGTPGLPGMPVRLFDFEILSRFCFVAGLIFTYKVLILNVFFSNYRDCLVKR